MITQVKIENREESLIFDCDSHDYKLIIVLLEAAWKNGYDTYIRRLEQGDSDYE